MQASVGTEVVTSHLKQRILLVDDEPGILEFVYDALTEAADPHQYR